MRRSAATAVCALLLAGCFGPSPSPSPPADEPVSPTEVPELASGSTVTLVPDVPAFWTLPTFIDAVPCVVGEIVEPSAVFTIQVPAGTAELRVAAERPQSEGCMTYTIDGPNGPADAPPGIYGYESIIAEPMEGDWQLALYVKGPRVDVRVRALASSQSPVEPPADVIQLPDLRPAPPWEIKFATPDHDSLPDAGGPTSCRVDELVLYGIPARCLRFSFATANLGPGRIEVHYSNLDVPGQPRPAEQWLYAPDGHYETRPAGQIVLHPGHAHYHWEDIYLAEIFPVTEGNLSSVLGSAFKKSGCWGDYFIGDWQRFDQWPGNSASSDNGCAGAPSPEGEEFIGLTPGWADIYAWDLEGNYVEFDGGDGDYVLRFTADPRDNALEGNETNNVAYAFFHVQGETITILERGYGSDPWDLRRAVVHGPWIP